MRKIVAGLFISLDGVVTAPHEWQFDVFDADMGAAMTQMMAQTDTVLLGRVTYQDWAPYWPTSTDEPFASFINTTPKYVVSTTLDAVDWSNATLITGDLAAALTGLKAQPGATITVMGSPTLVLWLLENNLLDELILMIHPVVAGHGARLFPDERTLRRLRLVDTTITGSGVIIATYQPRAQ